MRRLSLYDGEVERAVRVKRRVRGGDKAGVNVVVFKVINENNNWQGCLRFTDAAGKNLVGLTLKLAP